MFRTLRLFANGLCACALLFLPAAIKTDTVFTPGKEYTFYCGSVSSQAEIVVCKPACAAVCKYFLSGSLTGESTVYERGQTSAEEIIEQYEAELLFTERIGGTVNYYCRSPQLGESVVLGEYCVNLHIAESEYGTAVGAPLIFGGF